MINYIGQSKRETSNSIIRQKIRRQKSIFTFLLFLFPFLFILFQYNPYGWFSVEETISGDRMATCKLTREGSAGNGSAFLVSKNGLLITARHCVAENPDVEYTISFDMIKDPKYHNLKAFVIYLPERGEDDYAVLKLETEISIEPLEIAERITDPASYNPEVTIIGYPAIAQSQSIDKKNSVYNYLLELRDPTSGEIFQDSSLFIIDEIYPGYSGGPVIDNNSGKVIGICSWKVVESEHPFYSKFEGMSFCEKIQQVFTDPKASHINWE